MLERVVVYFMMRACCKKKAEEKYSDSSNFLSGKSANALLESREMQYLDYGGANNTIANNKPRDQIKS